ncbi:MAG: acetylxylan esterase [Clostridia bacterium]|nr:acetylxylan esterase [Clostridia bacterium]
MKKILAILLSILLVLCLFTACEKKPQYFEDDYNNYLSDQNNSNSTNDNSVENSGGNSNVSNNSSQTTNNSSKDNQSNNQTFDPSLIISNSSSSSKVDYEGGKVTLSGVPATAKESVLNYEAGQEINFVIKAKTAKQIYKDLQISYKAQYEDGTATQSGIVNCNENGEVTIKLKGKGPGFIYITATACVGGVEVSEVSTFNGGVGVDVDKITTTNAAPKDFETYWKDKIATLPAANTISTEKISSSVDYDIYQVKIAGPNDNAAFANANDNIEHNFVSAILCVPKKSGSYPVKVKYQAHGVFNTTDHSGSAYEIYVVVQSHSIDAYNTNKNYFSKYQSVLDGYQNKSFNGQSYFVNMLLRDYQVIRWIKQNNFAPSTAKSNGTISVSGNSQGGFRSTAVAALCGMSGISLKQATIGIVWNCNLSGHKTMNIDSWYTPYNDYTKYIDTVYFAPFVKCSVSISQVGLGDRVAPPSSNMALYNAFKSANVTFVQNFAHGSGNAGQTYYLSK